MPQLNISSLQFALTLCHLQIVIPGLMGCASFAPEVNEEGNSIWGLMLCEALDRSFNLHLYGPEDEISRPELVAGDSDQEIETTALLYAAAHGDLCYIRRMVARGVDINQADYDLRTALHLAASENFPKIVKFLIMTGAFVNAVDRAGNTPLDDATRLGHTEVIRMLESPPKYAVVIRASSPSPARSPSGSRPPSDGDTETEESPLSRATMMNGLKAFAISSASLDELNHAGVGVMKPDVKSTSKLTMWKRSLGSVENEVEQTDKINEAVPNATFETLLEVFERYGLVHLLSAEDVLQSGTLSEKALEEWTQRYPFLERALTGKMVIPDWPEFCAAMERIFFKCREERGGEVAQYIPQLAKVSPDKFGLCVTSTDGQQVSLGDSREDFCIQSCSKPITYCIAVEGSSAKEVHTHVGREPSGKNFNELALDKNNLPHNPLINAGAIMTCSLVQPTLPLADRFSFVLNRWKVRSCPCVSAG